MACDAQVEMVVDAAIRIGEIDLEREDRRRERHVPVRYTNQMASSSAKPTKATAATSSHGAASSALPGRD